MRIAFVTQWFPPEPGTFVAAAIADGLAARGHQVDVLTGFPNYPTGKLHVGYPLQRYRVDQHSERVKVHRSPLYPNHDANAIKRILNYLSFATSASFVARLHLQKPDAWLIYSSPPTAAAPAFTAPRRLRAPVHLLIQDLWPDSVIESGFTRKGVSTIVEKFLSAYCNLCYRRATSIGVISVGMQRIIIERGADPSKMRLLPNWVDDGYLQPKLPASDSLRRSLNLPTGRLFMYAGNLGELQGLGPLVAAFGRCAEASLVLVGDGVAAEGLRAMVSASAFGNVCFIPSQPSERIGEFIAASDVQIVSLKDSSLLRATMPSKVQTSMAACRPILVHAAGDAAELVVSLGAGLAVTPGDALATEAIIRAFVRMPQDQLLAMGAAGRAAYEQTYSPTAGLDRLESVLRSRVTDVGV